MDKSEVKIKQVSNGLIVTYVEPAVGNKGGGIYKEVTLLLEEAGKNPKRQVMNRLINLLAEYFQLNYRKNESEEKE